MKNIIMLKGKAGVKSMNIEYPLHTPQDENRASVLEWCNSLNVCINRANGKTRLS
jgi:hypothetical protein